MSLEALNTPPSAQQRAAELGLLSALLTLSGLSAFAIAQPLFDLLAGHLPFLIAHRLEPLDLVLLGTLVLTVPTAVVFAPVLLARLVSRKFSSTVESALVALLTAAIVLPPLHRSLPLTGLVLALVALALGAAAGVAHHRSAGVRTFSRLLSLGVVGFPLWFLLLSPASTLMAGAPDATRRLAQVDASTPVVLVVFDQFPLFTLLDENEQIDAIRYPSFAALAADADWFRNATSVAGETVLAVPALLTGRYPDAPRAPSSSEYPQNLFTLLGHDYQLNVKETMTDLCPASLCKATPVEQQRGERLAAVGNDLGFLYLHILLPSDLCEGLPDVGSTWRDFTNRSWISQDATPEDPKSSWGDPTSAFDRFLAGFDGRRERVLHFLHVNVPHVPWKYLPSGAVYGPVGSHLYPYPMNGMDDVGQEDGFALDRALQRHLLQVGFADRMLGDLVARLRRDELYDDALFIVTADHGITFWPTKGLDPSDNRAASDVLNVPLFIKRPHSRTGRVDDTNVETVDIVPTIAGALGIEIPEPVDGHSLYADATVERSGKRVFVEVDGQLARIDYASKIPGRRLSIGRVKRVFGPSSDPNGLFLIGRHREWIGRPVAELPIREERFPHTVELEFAEAFDDVDPDGAFVPARVTGKVAAQAGGAVAREVAIAVDGVLWATTQTFENVDSSVGFEAMVPQHAFRAGRNAVDIYVIDGTGVDAALRSAPRQAHRRFALSRTANGAETLADTDRREIPIVPGELTGEVGTRGAMLAGWARDARGSELPETILLFANGNFYEERDLARARSETAERAHLRDADQKSLGFEFVIPFEILRASDSPELRVFAVARGVASELRYLPGFAYSGRTSGQAPGRTSGEAPGRTSGESG